MILGSDRHPPRTSYLRVIADLARQLLDTRPAPPPAPKRVLVVPPARPLAPAVPTTCAVCGFRDACDREDDGDGRLIPVCRTCATDQGPNPDPSPNLRARVLAALGRCDSANIEELAAMLGMESQLERGRISATLARAEKGGLVGHHGGRMSREYFRVKQ